MQASVASTMVGNAINASCSLLTCCRRDQPHLPRLPLYSARCKGRQRELGKESDMKERNRERGVAALSRLGFHIIQILAATETTPSLVSCRHHMGYWQSSGLPWGRWHWGVSSSCWWYGTGLGRWKCGGSMKAVARWWCLAVGAKGRVHGGAVVLCMMVRQSLSMTRLCIAA
jgi:hypothetical protein